MGRAFAPIVPCEGPQHNVRCTICADGSRPWRTASVRQIISHAVVKRLISGDAKDVVHRPNLPPAGRRGDAAMVAGAASDGGSDFDHNR